MRETRAAKVARLAARPTENAQEIETVAAGKCPRCGTGLVQNLAFFFWYQCGAFAAESHRKPEYRGLPACGFQSKILDRESYIEANALVRS